MTAYKFLAAGGVAPFSGFSWPTGEPGPWVEARVEACASGIHGCSADDLPYWIHQELWEIELDGAASLRTKLVAPRGRLLRRIQAWDADAMQAYGDDCAASAAALAAEAPELESHAADAALRASQGLAASAAFIVARAAELAHGADGYARERARQAAWLRDRLALPGAA